jgi:type IX secretion system PorP/SprF family membrane protein
MKQRHTYLFIIIGLVSAIETMAQADISMATHWNNRANFNPAFIGRPDYLYFFLNTRKQWIGVKGSPVVFNFQTSEYFNSIRTAFGLSVVNDQVGATQALNPMLTYAFRMAKKDRWSMAMGLSGGVFVRTINGSLFEADNINDPSVFYNYEKKTKPDLNVGFEFQNNHFIYGVSSTHLFSIRKSDSLFLNTNHRYGYAIYKNEDPSMFSYSLGLQVVNRYNFTDLECSFSFRLKRQPRIIIGPLLKGPQEILDVGLTCRTSRQLTFLCGVMISPYLRIGYAFDQSLLTRLRRNQTHEIMIEYRIPARSASTTERCGSKEFWYR